KEIIERFVKLIWELDPDIISGYNIDGYDLPVLVERSAKHGMQRLQLARDHSSFFHLGERFWRLDGRILTDVWWAVRAEMRPKQETSTTSRSTCSASASTSCSGGRSTRNGKRTGTRSSA